MAKKEDTALTLSNTKQELLNAYNEMVKKIEEQSQNELKPEKIIEEKKEKEVIKKVDDISSNDLNKRIENIKTEINRSLIQILEKLEIETTNYNKIKEAIDIKNKELKELYDIEKNASSLAALIEIQNRKKDEFENQLKNEKAKFENEIKEIKEKWDIEKKQHDIEYKETLDNEKKQKEREKEQYTYNFERDKQIALNKLNDEKRNLEIEIAQKKEKFEKETQITKEELDKREKNISEREKISDELQRKADNFQKDLTTTVNSAIKETQDKLTKEHKSVVDLLTKEFEGKKNVYESKIESLEKLVKEQNLQNEKLSKQINEAYDKIQSIAIKTVEGASNTKIINDLSQMLSEKNIKNSSTGGEK